MLLSTAAAPVSIPTNNAGGLLLVHILANTCYSWPLDSGPCNWYEVRSHCGFDLHFPDGDVEHLCMCQFSEKCCFCKAENCFVRPRGGWG